MRTRSLQQKVLACQINLRIQLKLARLKPVGNSPTLACPRRRAMLYFQSSLPARK
jgi:hypothetical protein